MHLLSRFSFRQMVSHSSAIMLSLCLLAFLAACGGSSTASGSTPTPGGSGTTQTAATCDKATGLTVYSAQGYDSDATKAFQVRISLR